MKDSVVPILRLVKLSHTLFALPFACASFLLASEGIGFKGDIFFWVIVAMFGMRSAAMCFNRWLDADIDAQNPRTAQREIPAGVINHRAVLIYTVFFSIIFFTACYQINQLAFQLSPIAWIVCLGYSYCKRFTMLSHLVLGIALGLSPVGAWIAVRGTFDWVPILMGLIVVFWTAGFDILYACLDYDFDVRQGLFSLPAKLGISRALVVARVFHGVMLVLWFSLIWWGGYRWPLAGALILASLLIVAEHFLMNLQNLKRMNLVFFKLNVVVSLMMLMGCSLEVFL